MESDEGFRQFLLNLSDLTITSRSNKVQEECKALRKDGIFYGKLMYVS